MLDASIKLNVDGVPQNLWVFPMAYLLLLIFIETLRSGTFPFSWKQSVVVATFKSGSRCSIDGRYFVLKYCT